MSKRKTKQEKRIETLGTARMQMLVGLLDWFRIMHEKEIESADRERIKEIGAAVDRLILGWMPLAELPSETPGMSHYVDAETAAEVACGWAFDAGMREAERDRAQETARLGFFLHDVLEEQSEDDVSAAVAAERERCLAWMTNGIGYEDGYAGIASGERAPAPREG